MVSRACRVASHNRCRLSGLTLAEILIASALMAAVFLLFSRMVIDNTRVVTTETRKSERRNDLNVISGFLQKYMSGGDVRFFTFSGDNSAEKSLVRFLLPLPEKCADMSDCVGTDAFVFFGYDKSTTPAITGGCFINSDTSSDSDPSENRRMLVDIRNTSYGAATPSGSGFDISPPSSGVTVATGRVDLSIGQTVALLDPPNAPVWRVASALRPLTLNQDNTTLDITDSVSGRVLGDDCEDALLEDAVGRKQVYNAGLDKWELDLSNLYEIELEAFRLREFSGSDVVSNSRMSAATGRFPKRVFTGRVMSVGMRNGLMELLECDASGLSLNCAGTSLLSAAGFESMTAILQFSLQLEGSAAQSYHVRLNTASAPSHCSSPSCASLPLFSVADIPELVNWPGNQLETFDLLNPAGFSMLKMEFVSQLRVVLARDEGADKESFNVYFR